MAALSGPSLPAKSGEAKSAVVFLHGYGADGPDLLGLGDVLADHMPDTAFYAPNAPERSVMNPMGYQWFPIPRMDGSTEAQREAAMQVSIGLVNDYLDGILAETGLSADRLALVGFSQGTMMSLHVAPRRPEQLACVVGFSGMLLAPERLKDEIVTKPPVLLVHGDADPMVPFENMELAARGLSEAGIEVRILPCAGVPHSISPEGLGAALQMLKAHLD
ncbi:dienelactone hydrolase family protein [Albimonas sp. CAU 1670]|uniref:alpha/beta hydrolase n=1 Tax=Albimonas sp. CAU 1670 TaxID=3032599 RepID=UPI0023DB1840|nr:dienelactone hydrolase family protein [Albimonas sp. CAU 1670]MDF2232521.1 dienelactone hydrolase family protein [Albimonas sp. CAU 1670]